MWIVISDVTLMWHKKVGQKTLMSQQIKPELVFLPLMLLDTCENMIRTKTQMFNICGAYFYI